MEVRPLNAGVLQTYAFFPLGFDGFALFGVGEPVVTIQVQRQESCPLSVFYMILPKTLLLAALEAPELQTDLVQNMTAQLEARTAELAAAQDELKESRGDYVLLKKIRHAAQVKGEQLQSSLASCLDKPRPSQPQ